MAALFVRKISWINSRLQWFFIAFATSPWKNSKHHSLKPVEKNSLYIHLSKGALLKVICKPYYSNQYFSKLGLHFIVIIKKTNWVLNSYFHCNLHTKKLFKSKVRSLSLNYPLSFQSLHCKLPFKRYPSNFHFPFWTHIFCKEWK